MIESEEIKTARLALLLAVRAMNDGNIVDSYIGKSVGGVEVTERIARIANRLISEAVIWSVS